MKPEATYSTMHHHLQHAVELATMGNEKEGSFVELSDEDDFNEVVSPMQKGHVQIVDTEETDVTPLPHPEESEGLWIRFMLFWITPLVRLARSRPLSEQDLREVPRDMQVARNTRLVSSHWRNECNIAQQESREPQYSRALFGAFRPQIALSGTYQLCFLILQLIQPFIIGKLLEYVATGDGGIGYGIGLVFALGVVSFFSSLCIVACLYFMRRLGMAVRTSVMMSVYEHSLQLTTASRLRTTIGQTTNLMSIDAEKLFAAAQFVHFLWYLPLYISLFHFIAL